jgi:hypothetical protein
MWKTHKVGVPCRVTWYEQRTRHWRFSQHCCGRFKNSWMLRLSLRKYSPPPRRLFLLGMRLIRMRNIPYQKTDCYYPSCKHSHTALAHHHTPHEMVDVFSLRSSRTTFLSQPGEYLAAKVMRPPSTPAASNWRQKGYF